MKLYYSRGACSLSARIALHEAGLVFDDEKVDLPTKTTARGTDFRAVNPNGYVPALELDNGDVLTEAGVVLQYIADQKPEKQLVPVSGSMAHYRLLEWLNFITTELHKGYGLLFAAETPDDYKTVVRQKLASRLSYVEQKLGDCQYLLGDQFTVADAYLFVVLNWSRGVRVDLTPYLKLQAFQKRVAQRPSVHAAMKAEGLVK